MSRSIIHHSPTLLLLALGGCAVSGHGLERVRQLSTPATGQPVSWSTHTADDDRAEAAVRQLLARPLTPESAVAVALLNNRNLQAEFEDIGIAQADLVQAGLLKNPMFNAAYEFADGGGLAKINLSVTEDFISVLAIPMRKKMAAKTLAATEDRVAFDVVDLAASVRSAFYDYQAAVQLQELRQTALKAAQAMAETANQLHDVGNLNNLALSTQQAESGEALLAYSTASADVTDKRAALDEWMGLDDPQTNWTTASRLPDPPPATQPIDVASLQRSAVGQRLDLRAATDQAKADAVGLGVTRQFALLPDVQGGASAEREHDGVWETGPDVTLPIPLFDTGNAQVAAAVSKLRQDRRRVEAKAVEVRVEVRRAVNRLELARANVTFLHDTELPLRDRIVHETDLELNGMFVSVFQLLQARAAEVDAGRMYVEALHDYWRARVELDRVVGGPVDAAGKE